MRRPSESRKIAHLAEIYYIPFAPHLVSSPLGTMATCHVCATVPNFLVLEWHALEEREAWDSYVHVPDGTRSIVRDGHIALPDAPGIGVELDMEGVRRNAVPATASLPETGAERDPMKQINGIPQFGSAPGSARVRRAGR